MSVDWSITLPKVITQNYNWYLFGREESFTLNFWASPFPKTIPMNLVKGYGAVGELRASS